MQVYKTREALVLFFLIFFGTTALAQDKLWTVGTAKTVPKGTLEASVVHPWRYGVTGHFELSAHPAAFFIAPHMQGKYTWIDRKIKLASVHSISYPTLFLRTAGKWDAWAAIADTALVPNLVALKNELIVSYMICKATSCTAENYLISLKVGVKNALRWGDNTMGYINKAPFFHHTAMYRPNYIRYVGVDLDAYLTEKIDYSIDADFLQVRGDIRRWLVEQKGMLIWKPTEKFHLAGGYKISAGSYLNQFEFHITPFVDVVLVFKQKRDKEMNLFKEKMF